MAIVFGKCMEIEKAEKLFENLDEQVRNGTGLSDLGMDTFLILTDYLNMVKHPYGLCAEVVLDLSHHGRGTKTIKYHNLVEMHLNYTDILNPVPSEYTAFESNVHQTGVNWKTSYILEMTVTQETKIHTDFAEEVRNATIIWEPQEQDI